MSEVAEEFGAAAYVAAAPAEFGFVVEEDFVLAVKPREHLADGVEPDDAAAVDAGEEMWVEGGLDGIERGAHGVRFRAAMDDQVVAIGFDPGNVADMDKVGAGFFADEQAFGESAIAQDLIDQAPEALFGGVAVADVLFECAADDFAETIFGHGLEQIIEGMDFEGTNGVAIVGGYEDEAWRRVFCRDRNGSYHVEAVGAGHLDVEENEVGFVLADGGDGGFGVAGFADDFDVGLGAKETKELSPGGGFVVDDQNAERRSGREHTTG